MYFVLIRVVLNGACEESCRTVNEPKGYSVSHGTATVLEIT